MLRNLQNSSWHFWASLGLMTAGATLSTALAVKAEVVSSSAFSLLQTQSSSWRSMTVEEEAQAGNYILNSPLGIAALN